MTPITRIGDIWQIGPHRLCCANSTNQQIIKALFEDTKPDLVFTSPPYLDQRDYHQPITDWHGMMHDVFNVMPSHALTQIFINLGMVHRNSEWSSYFVDFSEDMRTMGWRRFALNVWDRLNGSPGDWKGRLAPCYELILHFNKQARKPNQTVLKHPGSIKRNKDKRDGVLRLPDGSRPAPSQTDSFNNTHKIPDNVIRLYPAKGNRTGHPAVFPISLPTAIINAYTNEQQIIYDPFAGSGSTIIAAHDTNRTGYGVEIEPSYVDQAIERIQKHTGYLAYRITDGVMYEALKLPGVIEPIHEDWINHRQDITA